MIRKQEKFRVEEVESAGILGFGTDWYRIACCDNDKGLTDGWISSKLESGGETSKEL